MECLVCPWVRNYYYSISHEKTKTQSSPTNLLKSHNLFSAEGRISTYAFLHEQIMHIQNNIGTV